MKKLLTSVGLTAVCCLAAVPSRAAVAAAATTTTITVRGGFTQPAGGGFTSLTQNPQCLLANCTFSGSGHSSWTGPWVGQTIFQIQGTYNASTKESVGTI